MGDRYSGRSPPGRGPARGPPRDRDDNPNVEYFGAGESYRPGGHTGGGPYRPVRERDNDRWNPPPPRERERERDERARREEIDSYIPPTSIRARPTRSRSPPPFRRQSRSPPPAASAGGRGRPELFPERAGDRRYSPPPRDRPRSPPRRRSRSPFDSRGRTPDYRGPRDFSQDSRRSPPPRRDSPPPPMRPRFHPRPRSPPRRPLSPDRNTYRPRSRSRSRSRSPPRRRDDRPTYADDRWRRRSPSPRSSAAVSRRSSPPVHPDRASIAGSQGRSPAPRSRYDDRDRRDDGYASRPRSPPMTTRRDDYDDRGRDDIGRDRDGYHSPAGPPTGPRGGGAPAYNRPPPTGPARSVTSQQPSPPPSGPTVSAHSRSSTFAPPAGPRAGGPPRDLASPPSALRGRTSLTYRAPGYRPSVQQPSSSFDVPTSPVPPSGPRAASHATRGDFTTPYSAASSRTPSGANPTNYNDYPFRPSSTNNSTSGTYPRSQRFDATGRPLGAPTGPSSITTTFNGGPSHTASPSTATPSTPANFVKSQLSTLERFVPGGRHTPGSAHSTTGLSADQERKMKMLDDDAERMRSDITDKQRAKREVLREWENRERESEVAALRSDLAEKHLRSLQDDDSAMVGAAF